MSAQTNLKDAVKAIFDELKTYDGSTGKTSEDAIEKIANDLTDAVEIHWEERYAEEIG